MSIFASTKPAGEITQCAPSRKLKKILMKYDLYLNKLEGMNFNIIKDEWSISRDLSVNYIAMFVKN